MVIEATPLTRPPGSELTITPPIAAPLWAMTQSPSTIAVARVPVNGSPVLFDLVDSVDAVNTGMDLPEANVKMRGGGGGGGGPGVAAGCEDPASTAAVAGLAVDGTSVPGGGPAGEGASGAGGVLPPAGDEAAACSEVFAFGGGLALSRAVSEPGLAAALDELDEVGGLEEQLS
jgi:hypothetical protein